MKKAFLAVKYYENMQNKELIEGIVNTLAKADIQAFAFARDVQNYEKCELGAKEIMQRCFEKIEKSDIFIIEASEPSIGIGIEAGFAYFKNIPVYLIAKKGAAVSNSIKAIAKKCVYYDAPSDLLDYIKSFMV